MGGWTGRQAGRHPTAIIRLNLPTCWPLPQQAGPAPVNRNRNCNRNRNRNCNHKPQPQLQVGRSPGGRLLLSESVNACAALRTEDDLIEVRPQHYRRRPYTAVVNCHLTLWGAAALLQYVL